MVDKTDNLNFETKRGVTLLYALLPVVFLIVLLSINVFVFGDSSLDGSNQMVLLFSAAFAAFIGVLRGVSWDNIFDGMINSINIALPSLLILLFVGALSGAWLVSGIVPAIIYIGLKILTPSVFLPATCVVCAIVSLATGSSWTTAATIGVALIGVAKTLGLNEGIAAGAVLSGAYFGDKISPLSDTTNLAPAVANTDLFTHIRYMLYTTLPSLIIALIIYLIVRQEDYGDYQDNMSAVLQALDTTYVFGWWLLIPPAVVMIMIFKKVSPVPVLFVGALSAIVIAAITQNTIIAQIAPNQSSIYATIFSGSMLALYGDVQILTSNSLANELLSSGGMAGMLGTVWLILAAMIFGGVMERTGMLAVISQKIVSLMKSDTGLIASTSITCISFNVLASDQYLSIVVPGKMYSTVFEEKGLAPENLSRTLEDAGTVTSVLVPWNTCGAFHSNVLGVPTLDYLPYCYFNIFSPLMTVFISAIGYKIKKKIQPAD